MIGTAMSGMLAVLLAKFVLNDFPHAAGILESSEYQKERGKLVDQYGSWSIGRAESVCRRRDLSCVEDEASRLLGAYRKGFMGS